jgi:hypothetical protein
VVITGRFPEASRRVAPNVARSVLLEWVRAQAPDIRIKHGRLESGKLAYAARFTLRGETIEVEAVESDDLPDPADAIVRRCAWLIQRRLGLPTALDLAERRRLESAIVDAARAGQTELADKLGLELVMLNEGQTVRGRTGTKFEDFGGALFPGKTR